MSVQFDRYKSEKSFLNEVDKAVDFSGQDSEFFMEIKVKIIIELATKHLGGTKPINFLDVGCGVGRTDKLLVSETRHISGIDVSEEVIRVASELNPEVSYKHFDGETFPFADGTFDFSFAICVMHHVPQKNWKRFVSEMRRVTRVGGLVVIFEHNPLNPLTQLVVRRCEFDDDAVLLTSKKTRELLQSEGFTFIHNRYFLFFPWRPKVFSQIERILGRVPLGAQYYVIAKR